eukprot:scaffold1167_cov418-Prasinococcus_capsulatus_cf.AAC.15
MARGACPLTFNRLAEGSGGALYHLSNREEQTTETDDIAIEKPAAHAGRRTCKIGMKTPAANGIIRTL